jgi:hypothetical protein
MKWEEPSDSDKDIIARQLQREPRNLTGVARRCRHACPQVVVNHPLPRAESDASYFPTVFWLTCPAVVRRISRIEDHGYIRRIQEDVQASRDFTHDLRDAQLEYIYLRNSLLEPEDRILLRSQRKPLARSLERSGIGGVADLGTIKCLHMHYAHYLATRHNPVGKLVDKMLSLTGAERECQGCRGTAEALPKDEQGSEEATRLSQGEDRTP